MMLKMFLAGSLLAWPALAAAQVVVPPSAKNEAGSWVTRGDYPMEEYVKGVEGVTRFSVMVGVDGKAKSCMVTRSSGSTVLDNIVCDRVTLRAKFNPARDSAGKKVEAEYRNAVKWTIPPQQAAEEAQIRAMQAEKQAH